MRDPQRNVDRLLVCCLWHAWIMYVRFCLWRFWWGCSEGLFAWVWGSLSIGSRSRVVDSWYRNDNYDGEPVLFGQHPAGALFAEELDNLFCLCEGDSFWLCGSEADGWLEVGGGILGDARIGDGGPLLSIQPSALLSTFSQCLRVHFRRKLTTMILL